MSDNLISQPAKKNFDFIDSIRCLSMMCIVFEHATHVGIYIFPSVDTQNIVYMCLVQLAKLGTISFFILAGFLIGSNFTKYTPLEYFKRRLSNTFIPWIIWSLVFVFAITYKFYFIRHNDPSFDLGQTISESFITVYFYSNYWFIINFLICIGVLLLFRKHLYSLWLGAILLLFTLIYSVNIYFSWFPPMHTMAIFGFVFFLWLGAQLNQHWTAVANWINSIPNWIWAILFVLTFALSVYETINLYQQHNIDPYNTLRFSNILYSLVCILILLKIRDFGFTKYFKPRETTFGIYLIHYIIVFNVLPEILRPFHFPEPKDMSIFLMVALSLLRFIIVYSLTFGLVALLNKTKLKWTIGR